MYHTITERAKKFCVEHKERLTKPRLEVLKIIAASSKPIGAYAILGKLGKVIDNPKPQTVYRAIDFWLKTGFIHNIRSLSAYIACSAGCNHEGAQLLLCDDCGRATEAPIANMGKLLKNSIANQSFTPSEWTIEVHGICRNCQE